ncbi:MAG: POTRA domain-containing protein [Pseudomonadota bacterium]
MAFGQGAEAPAVQAASSALATIPVAQRIREITFAGNNTTQPKTMLREISLKVGDVADPDRIERSRQAIQDLDLFNSVTVREEPMPDGVRVVFVVKEKFFLLPYPRLSANVDRQYSYGAQLEWNNLRGLNHSLEITASQSDANRDGYGKKTSYSAEYYAPFIADSNQNLSLSASRSSTPRNNALTSDPYKETQFESQVLLTRIFSTTAASQGWTVGGGVFYQHEDRYGPGAEPPYGEATALVGIAEYRDLHLKIYSEEGTLFTLRTESAINGLLSDYGYTKFRAEYDRYIPIGEIAHQTIQLSSAFGGRFNGPQEVEPFSLGGGVGLRGYRRYTFEGNSFYYAAATYQRPVGWDWLRVVAGIEAGNVAPGANSVLFRDISADVLLGLRLRVSWFVNLEFEAGWAIPLDGSSKGRFFGGRH